MKEDFLHYCWKLRRFAQENLQTTKGEAIRILQVGNHNTNSGPDFLEARIQIGDTVWAGNVEIHIQASDWYRHGHQTDAAYKNVILHVVYTADQDVLDPSGSPIPVLTLRDLIDYQTYRYYTSWTAKKLFIPCAESVSDIPIIYKSQAVEAALVERLTEKADTCLQSLRLHQGDMEQAFFELLCKAMGAKVNTLPFEHFSRITPISLIRKNSASILELSALFFGQAGLLPIHPNDDPYVSELQSTYRFQAKKYELTPMSAGSWKFARMRPQSFPTLRLAELAQLYFNQGALAQRTVENQILLDYLGMFELNLQEPYWLSRYTFGDEGQKVAKSIGQDLGNSILINAVAPFLFALASYNKEEEWKERAATLLDALPAESNGIVKKFENLGFPKRSAFDSQGLIGLKKSACDKLKCLSCKVGVQLLERHGKDHSRHL